MTNIMLYATIEYICPDKRQYQQQSLRMTISTSEETDSPLRVAVPVPVEYFYNVEEKILTIEGYRYVRDLLQNENGNTQLPDDVMNGFDD